MVGETTLWQIAELALSVAQMVFYVAAVDKYKDKLEDLGDKLRGIANSDRAKYSGYRSADPAFYSYYRGLPDYKVCESNIQRVRGQVLNAYAGNIRKFKKTLRRGYTPLATVAYNAQASAAVPQSMSGQRALHYAAEQERVDSHVLARWSAIASAPVGNEGNVSAGYGGVIKSWNNSLVSASQGFNSAGAAFGTALYNILDD